MKKLGLIPKLIVAIVLGIIVGNFLPSQIVRIFVTFSSIFGNFLKFIIPFIILGFVVAGIADLGKDAGKYLGITTAISYTFTIISGLIAYMIATKLLPSFIDYSNTITNTANPNQKLLKPFFELEMPPLMSVMTALITAFILGLGISAIKGKTLYNAAIEFQEIIQKTIKNVVIPFLPLHIMGIFANMTYTGEVTKILSVFWRIFLIVLCTQFLVIIMQFSLASIYGRKNLPKMLKNQIPAYLTAVGTQTSVATIPVNLQSAQKNGVSKNVREFVVPLCATIHLSGGTISLVYCSMAIMMMSGIPFSFGKMFQFIAMLGITMIAAPGVPGGAVIAALGIMESMLGFNNAQLSLVIALHIAQDSFGTACNISGDNAIAVIIDKIYKKSSLKQIHSKKELTENKTANQHI